MSDETKKDQTTEDAKPEEKNEEVKEAPKVEEKKEEVEVKETPKEESKPKPEEKKEEPKEEKEVEVPAKFKDLVKTVEEMSVLELSELVKVLEEKFGVSAAAPMAMAVAGPAGGGEEAVAEEKSNFDVELTEMGGNKIAVIKAIRAVSSLGLKDAKDLAEAAPKVVTEGVPKEEAETMKKTLEEAGAKVTLK